jgi:vancomycin resistance protein VanJ
MGSTDTSGPAAPGAPAAPAAPAAPTASAARPGPWLRLLGRLLWLCSWVYLAVAVGLWILLQWADHWWPANLVLFGPRWLGAIPLLVFVPGVLLARRKGLLVPLGLAAVVIVFPVMGFCVPWGTLVAPTPAGPRLRVLTCNMHGSDVVDAHALEDLILASGADIVALQEWPEAKASPLGDWPGWQRHISPRLFLASQFPIRQATRLGSDSYGPKGLVTHYELETSAGLLHFFSLHLASPRDALYQAVHDNPKGAAEVSTNSTRRWQQSEFIASHARRLQGPVLLAGDFNTPPESAIFAEVWGNHTDTFATAGWGWGYTFAGGRTLVRIDHILAGAGWHCTHCWVGPNVGSPHRPVIAELVWTGAVPADAFEHQRPIEGKIATPAPIVE